MKRPITPVLTRVTAEAPAGIGNLAVGFDILGQALAAPHDRVTITVRAQPGITITRVSGSVADLPRDPADNSATAGLLRILRDYSADFGLEVEIDKGIALGSGMGGSAASAVAATVAVNTLLGLDLGPPNLLGYALDGEEAATGSRHADNVASAITGGIVLVNESKDGHVLTRLPGIEGIFSVLVHPHLELETRKARDALPAQFDRQKVIEQNAYLAGFVSACHSGDIELLRQCLRDILVEPHRADLIKGFDEVKHAAIESGALGCSISGGGPSVFAWCQGRKRAAMTGKAMQAAFQHAGVASDMWVSPVDAPGARVVDYS